MPPSKKIVLVTGCTKGGIGFALCEEYARNGCKVYATARRLDSMDGFGYSTIEKLVLDVTSDDNVREVIKTIIDRETRIDVLVNNAGSNCAGALFDVPLETAQKAFDANTFSILRLVQAVLPHMVQRKSGTIVNIGSVVGNCPTPWNGIYAATKAAIHSISDVLWMETKPFGVHVVLVAPSYVKSNIATAQLAAGIPQAEDSPYRSFLPQIVSRVGLSQSPRAVTAEEFARQTVLPTLSSNPPRKIIIGGWALGFRILEWLPRTWVLRYFWNLLSKKVST